MLNNGHILTALEMQTAEQALIDEGISIEQLMQCAGEGAAQEIWRISADMPTLVLCGPGNNGGDGYVIAQWLRTKGVDVIVVASEEPKTDAAKNAKSQWEGKTIPLADAKSAPQFVDCLFGTGLKRPVDGPLLGHYQRLSEQSRRRVAIDLPSGVETDNGALLNDFPQFDLTIALGAFKPTHYLEPAKSSMGSVIGVEIGVESDSRLKLLSKPHIENPGTGDHKYTRGLVAVIAGEMTGAASLAALAAQNAGAGYVKIFAPEGFDAPNHSIVGETYRTAKDLALLLSDDRISAVAIGSGLGRSSKAKALIDAALESDKPLVLDADALVLLGEEFVNKVNKRAVPVVATPHQGEFSKISSAYGGSKIDQARELAEGSNTTILLKGSDTIIADFNGSAEIACSSCPWLSIAGTGDVLAGIIASRMAVEGDAYLAARQAQWIYTRAAQLAGPAFTPEHLIDHIPNAVRECL